jgi:hypothetical protein
MTPETPMGLASPGPIVALGVKRFVSTTRAMMMVTLGLNPDMTFALAPDAGNRISRKSNDSFADTSGNRLRRASIAHELCMNTLCGTLPMGAPKQSAASEAGRRLRCTSPLRRCPAPKPDSLLDRRPMRAPCALATGRVAALPGLPESRRT